MCRVSRGRPRLNNVTELVPCSCFRAVSTALGFLVPVKEVVRRDTTVEKSLVGTELEDREEFHHGFHAACDMCGTGADRMCRVYIPTRSASNVDRLTFDPS